MKDRIGPTVWLAVFFTLALLCFPQSQARAQLKDMPSQAELDPILNNAKAEVRNFIATLTKYRAQADEIDVERLQRDLQDFGQLPELIQAAHSGRNPNALGFARTFAIVTSLDDAAMEAGIWTTLVTTRACDPNVETAMLDFGLAVKENREMLREVSDQLSHPAARMMMAADKIVSASAAPRDAHQGAASAVP